MTRMISLVLGTTRFNVNVDNFPDRCGICHKNVDPTFRVASYVRGGNSSLNMESVFQCTNIKCNSLIIGYYWRGRHPGDFKLQKSAPIIPKGLAFNEEIKEISSNFIEIYNQALFAEQSGLTLISGIGYRKSLEFLIKDFLIFLDKDSEESILKMPLGQCINQLENHSIKEMAKRATWIGNDEAHYIKKWKDKDVTDLKKLIDVTIHFISMDLAAKKYLKEMS
jgi:hypothetical protein